MNPREQFDAAIRTAISESHEIGYAPTRFEQMIEASHPVEVAKKLVVSGEFQNGFEKVVGMGRPDLTLEHIMQRPEFDTLFTPHEIAAAKWRLQNV